VSTKITSAFVGCSVTLGEGFEPEQREGQIYSSLVAKHFMFDSDNLARKGASNHMIFLIAANAIRSQDYDMIFCQWSELNRLWLSPAPDAWYYATGHATEDYHSKDLVLDTKTQNQLAETILMLNHDYQNIMILIDYVNILTDLSQHYKTKIVFINGMLPWQDDLIRNISHVDQLSKYTRDLLDADNRDDKEVLILFKQLQTNFKSMNIKQWVNPFESFQSLTVDLGPLDHHPGPKSHRVMANLIHNYLETTDL
jgi:hypothetical protein